MRVDLHGGNAVPESTAKSNSAARTQSMGADENREEGSQFSSSGAGVSTLAAAALHAPEVRNAKVDALREQIASGTYQVSPHQVAASILDHLRTGRQSGS